MTSLASTTRPEQSAQPHRCPAPRHGGHGDALAQVRRPVVVRLLLPLVVRAGVQALLQPHGDRVLAVADDQGGEPDLELFDPQHPRRGPRDLGDVPRVALVRNLGDECRGLAAQQGAVAVVPLSIDAIDLVRVLEHARHQGRPAPRPVEHDDDLSPREREVLSLICRGLSNQEIARQVFLSINTVKTYIRTGYQKMGVTSRSQAVLWALENGY